MTRNEKEQTIISQIENYYYQEWKNETLEMNLKNNLLLKCIGDRIIKPFKLYS